MIRQHYIIINLIGLWTYCEIPTISSNNTDDILFHTKTLQQYYITDIYRILNFWPEQCSLLLMWTLFLLHWLNYRWFLVLICKLFMTIQFTWPRFSSCLTKLLSHTIEAEKQIARMSLSLRGVFEQKHNNFLNFPSVPPTLYACTLHFQLTFQPWIRSVANWRNQ